jgi:hypothetical protein
MAFINLGNGGAMKDPIDSSKPPGVCFPWEEKLKELPEITGDPQLAEKIWKDVDGLAYVYIWHCLVSF